MRKDLGCYPLLFATAVVLAVSNAFTVKYPAVASRTTRSPGSTCLQAEGFGVKSPAADSVSSLSSLQVKEKLLDLLPRMTGKQEEFRLVETYVNALEDAHVPAQTLDFLNFAMSGEWQLLFSTNLSSGPKPNFRLRELVQRIESDRLEGSLTNIALWDLAEDGTTFDATGLFEIKCTYSISQGARMELSLEDHVLQPSRGSKIPQDVPALVGMLHRAMPKELFDPLEHAMDTTYLDGNLRIVRLTGKQFEGVRNIFVRKGSIEIDPTGE